MPIDHAGIRMFAFFLAVALVLGLFIAGAQPFAVGLFPEPWDKLAHFCCFGLITLLLYVVTIGRYGMALIATVSMIGFLDEWHQRSLPGRSADPADFLTDVAAAIAIVALCRFISTRWPQVWLIRAPDNS